MPIMAHKIKQLRCGWDPAPCADASAPNATMYLRNPTSVQDWVQRGETTRDKHISHIN